MSREALRWGAALGALLAAVGFIRSGLVWMAALEVSCAVGLVLGPGVWRERAGALSQLVIILQVIFVAAIWPSLITVVGLLVLPAAFFSAIAVGGRRSSCGMAAYVAVSSALAAWSLATEAWLLAAVAA